MWFGRRSNRDGGEGGGWEGERRWEGQVLVLGSRTENVDSERSRKIADSRNRRTVLVNLQFCCGRDHLVGLLWKPGVGCCLGKTEGEGGGGRGKRGRGTEEGPKLDSDLGEQVKKKFSPNLSLHGVADV